MGFAGTEITLEKETAAMGLAGGQLAMGLNDRSVYLWTLPMFHCDGWAAGDVQARGFLLGATAGRTTLAGEGLQHQDGNSHVLALPNPSLLAYDPAFAYEIAVIVREGLRRMLEEGENLVYYLTITNEFYPMPAMPAGVGSSPPSSAF